MTSSTPAGFEGLASRFVALILGFWLPGLPYHSGQMSYGGGWFLVELELYPGFPEQAHEGVIGVRAKGHEPFYLGIDQHLGAQYARRMGDVNRGAIEAHAVE